MLPSTISVSSTISHTQLSFINQCLNSSTNLQPPAESNPQDQILQPFNSNPPPNEIMNQIPLNSPLAESNPQDQISPPFGHYSSNP